MGIKLKRSGVTGKAPAVTDLELGELAVNTWDGKLYLKKNDGADAIVEVGPVRSVAGRTGTVTLAKSDVGLGNVDNTSDAAKPVSTATQTALNGKANASHGHAISEVSGLQAALDGKLSASDVLGQQTIWVPAVAMYPRTTSGAAAGTVETSTNRVMLRTLDFDTATQEFAQFAIQMPKSWNEGTLICQFVWSHPAASTNFGVAWEIQALALANDDAADTAFGTAVTVTDTGGTANDIYITGETPALTVAGNPGPEEYVIFQVRRAPANAGDTLAVDARLHGVRIHYSADAAKDD
jgi:hypothetical protein